MIHKYNVLSLQERFDLTWDEIVKFIGEGLLRPIGWREKNHRDRMSALRHKSVIWDLEEVERFQKILYLVKDKHLHFYRLVNTKMNEDQTNLMKKLELVNDNIASLKSKFMDFQSRLEKKETMVDARHFCQVTGYKEQTFRNSMVRVDEQGMKGRLLIGCKHYKDLIWHKIKGRWQTPLFDFMELRKDFSYEIWLDEKRRKTS